MQLSTSQLGRYRYEFAFELAFLLACSIAVLNWNQQMVLALMVACIRLALPHWVTAFSVWKLDPDRWHGIAVASLFISWGFTRAALLGAVIFVFFVILLSLGGGAARQPWALTGLGTGFVCLFGYLILIFPFSLIAFLIAWRTGTRLDFAIELTRIRRSDGSEENATGVDVAKSIHRVSSASLVSLSISASLLWISLSAWFRLPSPVVALGFFTCCFVIPLFWKVQFMVVVSPAPMDS